MILRREVPADAGAVREVHERAFERPFDQTGQAVAPEAVLVDALRDDGDVVPGLSIVAELGGEVVGHVVCSRARIGDRPSLGLGPLGVLPAHQRRGVGSALVHGVLAAADALGAGEVVLLGDPGYYARFGFVLATPLGITPPEPAWAPHWQVRTLTAWDGTTGPFRYAPAFEAL